VAGWSVAGSFVNSQLGIELGHFGSNAVLCDYTQLGRLPVHHGA
jgi:hypothetical protein